MTPRWRILGYYWILYFCFGVAVSSTPALAVSIAADLGLTPAELGIAFGVWQLAYVALAFGSGLVMDRLGPRLALTLGMLPITLSLLMRGLANDLATLVVAIALLGLGGPLISIGQNKLVLEWFSERQRGMAAGIAFSGTTFGSVTILATANSVLVPLAGGWRGAFVVAAAVTAAATLVWWRGAPRSASDRAEARAVGAGMPLAVLPELVALRDVRLLLVLAVSMFMLSHGVNNWIPTILVSRGMTPVEAGAWAAVSMTFGLLGSLAAPRAFPLGRRRYTIAGIAVLLALGSFAFAFGAGPVVLGAIAVYGFARAGGMPVLFLLVTSVPGLRAARLGAATGLLLMFGEIGGFGGPFVIGLLRTASGGFVVPLAALGTLAIGAAGLALLVRESRARERDEAGAVLAAATPSD